MHVQAAAFRLGTRPKTIGNCNKGCCSCEIGLPHTYNVALAALDVHAFWMRTAQRTFDLCLIYKVSAIGGTLYFFSDMATGLKATLFALSLVVCCCKTGEYFH